MHRRTFAQWAAAETVYELNWPEATVAVRSTLRVDIGAEDCQVAIETVASRDGEEISRLTWQESLPR